MKKFIVTGGLGFIGSNLVKILLKKKFFVINIDKATYSSNFYNVKKFQNNKNYKFFKLDINNQKKIIQILNKYKPNGIYNLAAETHVDRSIDNPSVFIKSNILGTYNLLEAIKKYSKKKIKLVHISTDEVYGDVLRGRSKEIDQYLPSSPYSASKASSDNLVYSYFKTFKLNAVITNCSNNYGPRQHPEKLIPKMIYNLINGEPLPVYGRGKNSREWIYVDDHCDALIKIMARGKSGNSYNIGSNINLNNISLIYKLKKIALKSYNLSKKSKIKYVKDRPGHDFRYAINSSKIRKELKWKPNVNINEGLKKTFKWYMKNENYFSKLNKKDIIKRLGNIND